MQIDVRLGPAAPVPCVETVPDAIGFGKLVGSEDAVVSLPVI